MTRLRSFGRFWYEFVVGDDWQLAAGVVILLAVTWVLAHHGLNAWWLVPAVVVGLVVVSVLRAARAGRRTPTKH